MDTLLVDADGEAGGLAAMLDLPVSDGPGLAGFGPVTATGLAAAARAVGPRLRCLDLSGGDASRGQAVTIDGRGLAATARQEFPAVVLDLGHHPGRFQRELAAAADWLVWVVTTDRVGFERADRALGAAVFATPNAGLVLNRLGPGGLAGAGQVLVERHQVPLLAGIPDRVRAARDCERRAATPHRAREFRRPFAELARCLHPDLAAGGGRAWP